MRIRSKAVVLIIIAALLVTGLSAVISNTFYQTSGLENCCSCLDSSDQSSINNILRGYPFKYVNTIPVQAQCFSDKTAHKFYFKDFIADWLTWFAVIYLIVITVNSLKKQSRKKQTIHK